MWLACTLKRSASFALVCPHLYCALIVPWTHAVQYLFAYVSAIKNSVFVSLWERCAVKVTEPNQMAKGRGRRACFLTRHIHNHQSQTLLFIINKPFSPPHLSTQVWSICKHRHLRLARFVSAILFADCPFFGIFYLFIYFNFFSPAVDTDPKHGCSTLASQSVRIGWVWGGSFARVIARRALVPRAVCA